MVVGLVQINCTNFIESGEEEHLFIGNASTVVGPKLLEMRTSALVRPVETQETQVGAVPIVPPTGILNIPWLSTWVYYFDVKGLGVGPMNDGDVGSSEFIRPHHRVAPPVGPKEIIIKNCNCKWMGKSLVLTQNRLEVSPVVFYCVDGVEPEKNRGACLLIKYNISL